MPKARAPRKPSTAAGKRSKTRSRKSAQTQDKSKVPSPAEVAVVAIGASAGGLHALEKMFDTMPVDSGFAFVVIQHLSPDFRSMMDQLLARHSQMTIEQANDGITIQPNTIYLNPPRQDLKILRGKLHHEQPGEGLPAYHPIDAFFASLAADRGKDAVAVILSGTGNDGTRGARAILEAGGKVIVQEPSSAQFENMPRSAVEQGVASVTAVPSQIADILTGKSPSAGTDVSDQIKRTPEAAIFRMLERRYGANFGYYKTSTVGRRLYRRATLNGFQDLTSYAEMVLNDAKEKEKLYADLLIGVTAFFRDRAAFKSLEVNVVSELLDRLGPDSQVRVWVPGCATGEEAYSIAILFAEEARKRKIDLNLKIFATDLHAGSLDTASTGVFSAASLKDLSDELRSRYFEETDDKYEIRPEIRRRIVFSKHNLLRDPPFTRIDLITCRNVLIYFNDLAQRKVLSLFHFALSAGGHLFLGPSEAVGSLDEEFHVVDGRWRIFRKLRDVNLPDSTRLLPVETELNHLQLSPAEPVVPSNFVAPGRERLDRRPLLHAYDVILAKYAPPSLLVSPNGELMHVFGDADAFLELRQGAFSSSVGDILIEPLRLVAGACLDEVKLTGKRTAVREVTLPGEDQTSRVHVHAELLRPTGMEGDNILIVLEPKTVPGAPPSSDPSDSVESFAEKHALHGKVEELTKNLQYTEESLQTTIEELETSNEELQSTNEELMSANEELQSTNEELHAVNEELYSITSEHQLKIEELTDLTNDMDHFIRCTDVGTVFLDTDLSVRRFTPAAADWFNLLDRDIGRPFQHIVPRFEHPDLLAEVAHVAETAEVIERTIEDDEKSVLLRIFPYLVGDVTKGTVLTLVDVTRLKLALVDVSRLKRTERMLQDRNKELARLIGSLKQFTYIVSHDLRAPLRSISNSAKWIEEDLGDAANADVRAHCARLVTYTHRLATMLDDLREYARLDVGEKAVSEVNITDFITSMVDTLDPDGRADLQIDTEVTKLSCCRAPLFLVLQNLLDNALKYAGKQMVGLGVRVEDLGEHIRFSVSDNGPGIPPRHHEKIFLPFQKLSKKDETTGTGMGLALVKKAVEDNGGFIEVLSDPGKEPGTTIRFTWAKLPSVTDRA